MATDLIVSSQIAKMQPGRSLPATESKLIVSVLHDSVSQLHILGNTLPAPLERCVIKYETPEKRYGDPSEKELTSVKGTLCPINDQIIQKLQMERTLLEGIISGTIGELIKERTFMFLQNAVSYLQNFKDDNENSLAMEKYNQDLLMKIQKDLSEEQKNSDKTIQEKCDQICYLQDKIISEMETEKVIMNFVKHWEKASQEQLKMKLTQEMNRKHEKLKRYSKCVEDECEINESVIKYLSTTCEELNEKITRWKEHYENDVGEIENAISDLKSSKEIQSQKYNELEKEFNIRQTEMDAFTAIKEERLRREAEEKLKYECAVRLQSWWRGLMVRRCLGQFRRRKKVVKEPKAKKKKPKGKK